MMTGRESKSFLQNLVTFTLDISRDIQNNPETIACLNMPVHFCRPLITVDHSIHRILCGSTVSGNIKQ